jgi:hypothetical protein
MQCQNDSLSWIQAGSTVVLVVVTIAYVILTWRILSASTTSSKDAKMPVLVFRFLEEKDFVSERIVNIGQGPALDIRLQSNGVFNNGQLQGFQKGHSLETWPLPIDNSIGPDNGNPALQVCYLISTGHSSILKHPDAELLLTYKDVFGREFQTRFVNLENKFAPVKR